MENHYFVNVTKFFSQKKKKIDGVQIYRAQ